MMASSSLHDGAQTACDLPSTLRVVIWERGRCLPHKKHDMVAPPKDAAAMNGEPDTLDLYRKPSGSIVVLESDLDMKKTSLITN